MKNTHPYTFSLLANIKWAIKRAIKLSVLDKKIGDFLRQNFPISEVCLNLGCGVWTPYDSIIKKNSKSLINVDATCLALVFHPLTGKKIVVNDRNIYELLKNKDVTSIVSFHSLPFIHINLPKLLLFCFENKVSFSSDISFQSESDDISPYFYGSDRILLIDALDKTDALIYDVSNESDYIKIKANQMTHIGRYLIHIR